MTITAMIAGAIGMLANFAFFMGGRRNPLGLGGRAAGDFAGAHRRHAGADRRSAARANSKPTAPARNLPAGRCGWPMRWRRSTAARARPRNAPADANPATAHMFIVNPLHGGMCGLFASHPPTAERIARLRAMAQAPTHPQAGPWG